MPDGSPSRSRVSRGGMAAYELGAVLVDELDRVVSVGEPVARVGPAAAGMIAGSGVVSRVRPPVLLDVDAKRRVVCADGDGETER